MRPSISFNYDEDESDPLVGLEMENAGPGVAHIQSVTFYVDGKPVSDGDAAVSAGKLDPDFVYAETFDKGDSLKVGGKAWLISQYTVKDKREGLNKFLDFIDGHLAVKVIYCSVSDDDCESRCSTVGRC